MHGFAHLHDMVVIRLVGFLLFLFQIDDVAFLQREVFRHLVILLQVFHPETEAGGNIVETVPSVGVDIQQSVCPVDRVFGDAGGLLGGFRCASLGGVVTIELLVFDQFDQPVGISPVGCIPAFLQAPCPTFVVRNL